VEIISVKPAVQHWCEAWNVRCPMQDAFL
jgi:hypothetical protein